MLVSLYKLGKAYFCLLSTSNFHVKTEKDRFTVAGWRCSQNLKYKNFTLLFCRLRQNEALLGVLAIRDNWQNNFRDNG